MRSDKSVRSIRSIQTAKVGYLVISAALCILGVLLIVYPTISAKALCYILGGVLTVYGIIKMVGYFSKDLYRLAFQHDLTSGIILIALGVIVLINPASLMIFVCSAMGLFFLLDGVLKIQTAFEAKKFGLGRWWLIFAMAVITGLLGLALMLRPGAGSNLLMILLGISILSEGILNLITAITAIKIIKNQRPDVIEGECEERDD